MRVDRHIGALDGLRSIAIVLVLLFHLTPGRNPDLGVRALPLKIADVGWSGVDLFFVLSGFLITSKLLEARDDRHRFRDFYTRRTLRIFPLYYATLLVVFVVLPLLRLYAAPRLGEQLPYWFYVADFAPRPLAMPMQLTHFWSLAIEEQFYAVWPLLVFLTSRRNATRICAAMLVAFVACRFALAHGGAPWETTFSWPCRADGLAVGALIALVEPRRLLRPAIAAALMTVPFLGWLAWKGHGATIFLESAVAMRTLLPLAFSLAFGALLVFAVVVPSVARALTNRAFTFVARYSYGMYVFHFLLLFPLLRRIPPSRLGGGNAGALAFFAIASAISFTLAAMSYELFERHCLRRSSADSSSSATTRSAT